MSTLYKGGTSAEGTGAPPATNLALHASAQVGDFIVIAGAGVDVTDSRFTQIGTAETWAGPATDLSDIEYTNTGFHWVIVAAVFEPAELGTSATATGSSNPGVLPQVDSLGLVIASLSGSTGSLSAPSGFTAAVARNQGVAFVSISYLLVSGTSPAATFTTGGIFWAAAVFTARVIHLAPPCRVHPRKDGLGAGGGRIWPPTNSHQSGRPGGFY